MSGPLLRKEAVFPTPIPSLLDSKAKARSRAGSKQVQTEAPMYLVLPESPPPLIPALGLSGNLLLKHCSIRWALPLFCVGTPTSCPCPGEGTRDGGDPLPHSSLSPLTIPRRTYSPPPPVRGSRGFPPWCRLLESSLLPLPGASLTYPLRAWVSALLTTLNAPPTSVSAQDSLSSPDPGWTSQVLCIPPSRALDEGPARGMRGGRLGSWWEEPCFWTFLGDQAGHLLSTPPLD